MKVGIHPPNQKMMNTVKEGFDLLDSLGISREVQQLIFSRFAGGMPVAG